MVISTNMYAQIALTTNKGIFSLITGMKLNHFCPRNAENCHTSREYDYLVYVIGVSTFVPLEE